MFFFFFFFNDFHSFLLWRFSTILAVNRTPEARIQFWVCSHRSTARTTSKCCSVSYNCESLLVNKDPTDRLESQVFTADWGSTPRRRARSHRRRCRRLRLEARGEAAARKCASAMSFINQLASSVQDTLTFYKRRRQFDVSTHHFAQLYFVYHTTTIIIIKHFTNTSKNHTQFWFNYAQRERK